MIQRMHRCVVTNQSSQGTAKGRTRKNQEEQRTKGIPIGSEGFSCNRASLFHMGNMIVLAMRTKVSMGKGMRKECSSYTHLTIPIKFLAKSPSFWVACILFRLVTKFSICSYCGDIFVFWVVSFLAFFG